MNAGVHTVELWDEEVLNYWPYVQALSVQLHSLRYNSLFQNILLLLRQDVILRAAHLRAQDGSDLTQGSIPTSLRILCGHIEHLYAERLISCLG
ncbi:hypothetical protein DQ04_08781030 [Trypanosoma grayi]|uniref:hypothetical protein n=1 Tax=Trypanosoma grayi TaxID=71804 RepID=UPI0004F44AB7|nr:hypothetical protein DQ04_08781030 [Trypanosoma grayi]KEG07805.1 hypothetical protein DQ04_08781030 [Trypanosoma grayi]